MKKNISKKEALEDIERFFLEIKNKNFKSVGKIIRLAKKYNIPLREKRKTFCKKCLHPYFGIEKVRIKNKVKTIACENCGNISRWKLK